MLNLAKVYGVSTKRLNEQIKRNRERFPEDFMFQLTIEEARATKRLRSQFATLKRGQPAWRRDIFNQCLFELFN